MGAQSLPRRAGYRIWRHASRKLGVFPSPSRGPRDACVAGWLWGGARGGGTANKEVETKAPPPPTPPQARSASTLLAGGEHGELASPFPLKCDSPALRILRGPKEG